MRIAVTGAQGMIGSRLAANLAADHEVVRLDRADADILQPAALEAALCNCDAVVHLAAGLLGDGGWDDVWDVNLLGLRNVFEVALHVGCRRVIFGSSLHVMGMYEDEGRPAIYAPLGGTVLRTETAPRPGNPYAVTKACGEILARYYSDAFNLNVACVRIGTMNAADKPDAPDVRIAHRLQSLSPAERQARARSKWFSHADFARLVRAILAANVRFGIVYGVGDNAGRFVDLEAGRALYGFWPQDGVRVERS